MSRLRRLQALRRAVELTLWHGRIWTAELVRLAGVDIANAWRCLGQAEELGLLAAIPTPRGRGGGRLLTVPPLARAAGTLPGVFATPKRRATSLSASTDLAEFDLALAEIDRELARP